MSIDEGELFEPGEREEEAKAFEGVLPVSICESVLADAGDDEIDDFDSYSVFDLQKLMDDRFGALL